MEAATKSCFCFPTDRLRAEFLRQTREGDRLTPALADTGTECVLALLSDDGKPQAAFAFSRKV